MDDHREACSGTVGQEDCTYVQSVVCTDRSFVLEVLLYGTENWPPQKSWLASCIGFTADVYIAF